MDQMPFGDFCWNELATANLQAAKDFYGHVFGWTFSDHEMGDTTYTMIHLKDRNIMGGIWSIPKNLENKVPPHWMTYVLVEKIEDALEKATKHGAKIAHPAKTAGDFGRFAVIEDPTGAHVALWQRLK